MAAPLRPDAILLLATGHWAAGILKGAVAMGLFTQIARGNETAAAIAAAVSGDATGIAVSLNALTVLGLLRKEGERYELRPLAETYLVEDASQYLGDLVVFGCGSSYHFDLFAEYQRVLERGRALKIDVWEDEEYAPRLAASLSAINAPIAEQVCDALGWASGDPGSRELLDLGRSGGAYGVAALQRLSQARLAHLDLPHIVGVAREFAAQHGVQDRLTTRPGDCRSEPLGGPYDVIFMSQLLHTYPDAEQRQLLGKCRTALAAAGRLVIVEFLPDEERKSNMAALLFEAMMYGFSGRTFHTPATLRALVEACGFSVQQLTTTGPGGFAIAKLK